MRDVRKGCPSCVVLAFCESGFYCAGLARWKKALKKKKKTLNPNPSVTLWYLSWYLSSQKSSTFWGLLGVSSERLPAVAVQQCALARPSVESMGFKV